MVERNHLRKEKKRLIGERNNNAYFVELGRATGEVVKLKALTNATKNGVLLRSPGEYVSLPPFWGGWR